MTEDSEENSLVGATLCSEWRVLRAIGKGGMSTVYEAEASDGSRVALKVLHEGLARSPRTRERFLREGQLLETIGHPDAVRVLDTRETSDGKLLLVMELLTGQTLRNKCRESGGQLPVGDLLRIADGVLGVLSAAHAKSIVHRDIKPENIFLTTDGGVKVLDFGVAAIRDQALQDASITQSGSSLGTPAFMAPEQARGRQSQVDARTDIWSLGASLFYCLAARNVHEEALTANEAVIFAATQRAPSLRRLRPDLATSLVSVVDRALAFDPADRWASADAMRRALATIDLNASEPLRTAPGSTTTDTFEAPSPPMALHVTSRRLAWITIGVATLAVGIGAAGRTQVAREAHPAQEARLAGSDLGFGAAPRGPAGAPSAPERILDMQSAVPQVPRTPAISVAMGRASSAETSAIKGIGKRFASKEKPRASASHDEAVSASKDIPDIVLNRRQ